MSELKKTTGSEYKRRTSPERPHMPLSERAKIFIPFEPLKGFREALAQREEQALKAVDYYVEIEDDEVQKQATPVE